MDGETGTVVCQSLHEGGDVSAWSHLQLVQPAHVSLQLSNQACTAIPYLLSAGRHVLLSFCQGVVALEYTGTSRLLSSKKRQ